MPKVFVGTYRKYNNGSISGDWLDLEDYSDRDEFYLACAELHSEEEDPELMFQDWEDIPGKFIGESHLAEDTWPSWIELDEDTRARCTLAWENVDDSMTVEQVNDKYAGAFDSEEDWAYEYWDGTGMLAEVPKHAQNYIDYKAYARDCQLGGDVTFVREQGRIHVFMNNY